MPRGKLNEKHVQQVALGWLASYYETKLGVQAVVPETEVRVKTKSKLGFGSADGLVASLLPDGVV